MIDAEAVYERMQSESVKTDLHECFRGNPPFEEKLKSLDSFLVFESIDLIAKSSTEQRITDISNILRENYLTVSQDIVRMLIEELRAYCNSSMYISRLEPRVSDFSLGFTLYRGEKVEVSVMSLDDFSIKIRKKNLASKLTGFYIDSSSTIYCCLQGSFNIGMWTSNQIIDSDNICNKFDGTYNEFTLSEGNVLSQISSSQGITFLSASRKNVLLSVKILNNSASVAYQYDSKNNNLLSVVAADNASSRLQVASVALRRINQNYDLDIEILSLYLDHPNQFIRWHCAREIFLRNPSAAKSVFKALLSDSSDMIRESAKKCLESARW